MSYMMQNLKDMGGKDVAKTTHVSSKVQGPFCFKQLPAVVIQDLNFKRQEDHFQIPEEARGSS